MRIFLFPGELRLVAGRFHPILEPAADLGFLDVNVFDANMAAVSPAEIFDQLAQLHLAAGEMTVTDIEGLSSDVGLAGGRTHRGVRRGRGAAAGR